MEVKPRRMSLMWFSNYNISDSCTYVCWRFCKANPISADVPIKVKPQENCAVFKH